MTAWARFERALFAQQAVMPDEPTLEPLRRALRAMGRPQDRLAVVTVAGTNGKGSTALLVAEALRASGVSVGLYTSPHLRGLEERFLFARGGAGEALAPMDVAGLEALGAAVYGRFARRDLGAEAAGDAEALRARGEALAAARGWGAREAAWDDGGLTRFEVAVAMAVGAFAEAGAQVAVLEVGLGGRLDAVNAVDASVAVLVSVGLEHTRWLGTTLAQIAREKAGVFRAGAPALVGPLPPEAREAVEAVAATTGARLEHIAPDPAWAAQLPAWLAQGGDFAANAALAAAAASRACALLGGARCDDARLRAAWRALRWPMRRERLVVGSGGRWACADHDDAARLLDEAPPAPLGRFVIDAAHNPHGARSLARWLAAEGAPRPAAGVLGLGEDKDAAGVLAALADAPREGWWVARSQHDRARPTDALAQAVQLAGGRVLGQGATVAAALEGARRSAGGPDGDVLLCGSLYLIGDALDALGAAPSILRPDLRADLSGAQAQARSRRGS